tara:strand:+ start:64 stop:564 length:501 start_codon:yes stop_codon:yes gene_type:complete
MGKETSQITRFYDAVDAFLIAFRFWHMQKSPKEKDGDYHMSFSNDHFKLESSNPADTIKVATFLRNKQRTPNENIKKDHYYVCEFTWDARKKHEDPLILKTDHVLFMIFWEDDFNCWQRTAVCACRDASSHQEAAEWMLNETTTKGSDFQEHTADYFKNGTLEVIK